MHDEMMITAAVANVATRACLAATKHWHCDAHQMSRVRHIECESELAGGNDDGGRVATVARGPSSRF